MTVIQDTLTVDLNDGRTISAPLAWFPRLLHSTAAERKKWRFIGMGQGIHWEEIDEDVSVEGLLAGRPSDESQGSLEKWFASRKRRRSKWQTRSHVQSQQGVMASPASRAARCRRPH